MPHKSEKKILIFSPQLYPCIVGGLEVFNYYLINELNKDYNLKIITECEQYLFEDKQIIDINRFKRIRTPLFVLKFLFKNRKKISLIYFPYAKSYWTHWLPFIIAKKLFNIPYFFTIHGGGLMEWKPKWPQILLFKNAEFVTGVSNRIVEEYEKRANREILLTPPLIPFNIHNDKSNLKKKWKIAEDENILLYAGSLIPLKSVETLIEAVSILDKKLINEFNIKVLIAGDGSSRKKLEQMSEELGTTDVIKFLGLVEKEKLSELFAIASYYTICSKFEGLPISLLEAYANGLPSIVSDAPGLREVARNNKNSLIFKTENAVDYASKLEELIVNKELQHGLKTEVTKFYNENYSYSKLVESFKKIIDKYV